MIRQRAGLIAPVFVSSCPDLFRASTRFRVLKCLKYIDLRRYVDGRVKPGHDGIVERGDSIVSAFVLTPLSQQDDPHRLMPISKRDPQFKTSGHSVRLNEIKELRVPKDMDEIDHESRRP